ncbi:hypothetical protein A2W24_02505 [Microgenomates group bacterium RBG_16_45_19]|nr:MAG: hypothetical protein A2W24_02505 [Microgenomates group bacterium RBG_16_45_19]
MTRSLITVVSLGLILAGCTAPASPPAEPTAAPTQVLKPLSTASADITTQIYSLDEVAKHHTPQDCWLVIRGKVYDVSGFGEAGHPGKVAIYQGCGTDATTLFETRPMGSGTPHSANARTKLDGFYLGDLAQ